MPSWFSFYILVLLALTLFPFRQRMCEPPAYAFHADPIDAVANVLTLVPRGARICCTSSSARPKVSMSRIATNGCSK